MEVGGGSLREVWTHGGSRQLPQDTCREVQQAAGLCCCCVLDAGREGLFKRNVQGKCMLEVRSPCSSTSAAQGLASQ